MKTMKKYFIGIDGTNFSPRRPGTDDFTGNTNERLNNYVHENTELSISDDFYLLFKTNLKDEWTEKTVCTTANSPLGSTKIFIKQDFLFDIAQIINLQIGDDTKILKEYTDKTQHISQHPRLSQINVSMNLLKQLYKLAIRRGCGDFYICEEEAAIVDEEEPYW